MNYRIYNYNIVKSKCYSYYYYRTNYTTMGEYHTYLEMPTYRTINIEPYTKRSGVVSTDKPIELLDILYGIDRKVIDGIAKSLISDKQRFQEYDFVF